MFCDKSIVSNYQFLRNQDNKSDLTLMIYCIDLNFDKPNTYTLNKFSLHSINANWIPVGIDGHSFQRPSVAKYEIKGVKINLLQWKTQHHFNNDQSFEINNTDNIPLKPMDPINKRIYRWFSLFHQTDYIVDFHSHHTHTLSNYGKSKLLTWINFRAKMFQPSATGFVLPIENEFGQNISSALRSCTYPKLSSRQTD